MRTLSACLVAAVGLVGFSALPSTAQTVVVKPAAPAVVVRPPVVVPPAVVVAPDCDKRVTVREKPNGNTVKTVRKSC